MTGTLQPLDSKFAIVDRFGNPTEYFTRWAQQRQIDIGDSIQLTDLQAYLTAHKLIPGVGIQFTPDGDINHGVNIHADAQAILDEITATRGAILYRGLLGWAALLPGIAGNVLSTNGAGADPTWIAAGGGGGGIYPPFSPPLKAALTLASGDATNLILTDDTDVGLIFDGNTFVGGSLSRIATMQLPTGAGAGPGDTDWSFFAEIMPSQPWTFGSVGLHLYESATGKQLAFGILPAAGDGLYAWGATTLTGFSTTVKNSAVNYLAGAPLFIGFKYIQAAAIYYFMISGDGKNWVPWVSATKAASFTTRADRVGFGVMHGALSTMTGDKRMGSCRWFSKTF